MNGVFCEFTPTLHNEGLRIIERPVHVEAESDTFTVSLRVVGGNEKGTLTWWYNWATLFLGDINMGTCPPSWRSLESETVEYGHESHGTWGRE
jgi:hypothetical protein